MAAGRSLKSLLSRRRRAGEEGEDEDGSEMVEDSQSEGSALSEQDDEQADTSSVGAPSAVDLLPADSTTPDASANKQSSTQGKKPREVKKSGRKPKDRSTDAVQSQTAFKTTPDTEAMMNGVMAADKSIVQESVEFETTEGNDKETVTTSATNRTNYYETVAERHRRDHEEYRKKRDSDPAFIPNRGTFFMHDARGQQNGQGGPPLRGAWQNRGRGRGSTGVGGPFSPANQQAQAERAAEQPWKHDLHETLNEESSSQAATHERTGVPFQEQDEPPRSSFKPGVSPQHGPQTRGPSFSSTTLVGKVQIRVFLPGMGTPISFSEVPWKRYTRLPDHRPPLRRDKPVRVLLPERTQRFIFPATERSFIFIPRQMRPNQQGFHRGYQRSFGGGHGYSSRRTSMYGGSIYSGSIAASRRSSAAGIPRENAFSPVGSFAGLPSSNRPIVRLPHSGQQFSGVSSPSGPLSGQHTPTSLPHIHTYPLPQQPTYQGTPTTTMHQPRPQKTISVNDIESPAMLQQQNSQDSQPFQNQLPAHMHEQVAYGQAQAQQPPYFSPRQSYVYPQPPQNSTPLSGIPEQARHAPPFQPAPPMQYGQPPYYAVYPPQQGFYYPPLGPNGFPPSMPMFIPPQNYPMQQPPQQPPSQPSEEPQPPPPPPSQQQKQGHRSQPSQSGMVAHESNGMVFYMPASEAQQSDQYQPAESFVPSYAMPGLPPPTPAPDTSVAYYYPPMQDMDTGVYYPTQQ